MKMAKTYKKGQIVDTELDIYETALRDKINTLKRRVQAAEHDLFRVISTCQHRAFIERPGRLFEYRECAVCGADGL